MTRLVLPTRTTPPSRPTTAVVEAYGSGRHVSRSSELRSDVTGSVAAVTISADGAVGSSCVPLQPTPARSTTLSTSPSVLKFHEDIALLPVEVDAKRRYRGRVPDRRRRRARPTLLGRP